MRAKKDPKTGKWYIRFRYTDWQGKRRETMKRGFETKREAEEWLRTFLAEQKADLNITFADFTEMYFKSISPRLRENTLRTKHYIIDLKIMPYFGLKKITEITPANIIAWENELLAKGYSQTYMKTVYNQLNAIFNYAVKYYDLQSNPCSKAGAIGKNKADEMNFWTNDEFTKFVECVADKPMAYVAYNTLFWTGLRIGELSLDEADCYSRHCKTICSITSCSTTSERVFSQAAISTNVLGRGFFSAYCLRSSSHICHASRSIRCGIISHLPFAFSGGISFG